MRLHFPTLLLYSIHKHSLSVSRAFFISYLPTCSYQVLIGLDLLLQALQPAISLAPSQSLPWYASNHAADNRYLSLQSYVSATYAYAFRTQMDSHMMLGICLDLNVVNSILRQDYLQPRYSEQTSSHRMDCKYWLYKNHSYKRQSFLDRQATHSSNCPQSHMDTHSASFPVLFSVFQLPPKLLQALQQKLNYTYRLDCKGQQAA